MVRRSTVDRSPQPELYSAGYGTGAGNQPQGHTGRRPQSGSSWRGAGGRWLVCTFHLVVWAVLLIIGYRGVMAIVLNETPPTDSNSDLEPPGFPAPGASAYALQFGQVYLNASPAVVDQRASHSRRGPPHKDGLVRQHETASVKRAEVPGQGRLRS